MFGRAAQLLEISMLISWMTCGGVSVLGRRVEIITLLSGNSLEALSATLVMASAVPRCRVWRSLVPVCTTMYWGLPSVSCLSSSMACVSAAFGCGVETREEAFGVQVFTVGVHE